MNLEKYELRQDTYYDFDVTSSAVKPTKKEVFVPCNCGNEIIRLTSWSDEDEIYLSFYSFVGDKYSLWERIKILFCGKVRVGDVVLSSEEFNKIKQF